MADCLSLAPELQDEAALGANVTPEASWHTDDSLSDSTVSPQLQPARRAGDQASLTLPAIHKQALQQAREARIVRFQDLADAPHARFVVLCCTCSCCAYGMLLGQGDLVPHRWQRDCPRSPAQGADDAACSESDCVHVRSPHTRTERSQPHSAPHKPLSTLTALYAHDLPCPRLRLRPAHANQPALMLMRRSLDRPFKRSPPSSRSRPAPNMEPLLRSGSGDLLTPPGAFISSTAPAHTGGLSEGSALAPQSIPEDVPLPSLPRPRSAVHLAALPPIRKSYPSSLDPGSIDSWQSGRP